MNYLKQYYDEIELGKIKVGNELKMVLDSLISDLDNPKYFFDEKPGELRINFIETFCKHTKSPFNGQPFVLELWEKAFLQTAYGFKYSDTGLRRFTEALLLIARKNGKTTFVAGIDLAEFFLSSGGVDIICASNTNDQASILFEEINNMREQSKALSKENRSRKNLFFIYSPRNKNKIKKLSAQSRNLDGYNVEIACIDEAHQIWLYTQDSTEEVYNDKSSWVKSNPSLGRVKAISYLEDIMNKSKNDLSTRVTMLCKDFNIKQLESGTWLSFDDLNNETTFDIEFLRDSYAIGGVDLSSTTDLTCALLLVIKEGKKYIVPHFFMPSEVVQKRIQEDSAPYDLWIKRGLITLTDGSQNDFTKVTEWFLQMVREYGIRPLWIGYDPWNAQYWVNEMEEHGFNMEKIRQGIFTLSEPMKQLEADLKNKGVIYDNNPILKWCLANTQAKVDVNGNIQPSKMNSKYKRIDGCVALIIAYAVLNRYKNDYTNMSS